MKLLQVGQLFFDQFTFSTLNWVELVETSRKTARKRGEPRLSVPSTGSNWLKRQSDALRKIQNMPFSTLNWVELVETWLSPIAPSSSDRLSVPSTGSNWLKQSGNLTPAFHLRPFSTLNWVELVETVYMFVDSGHNFAFQYPQLGRIG